MHLSITLLFALCTSVIAQDVVTVYFNDYLGEQSRATGLLSIPQLSNGTHVNAASVNFIPQVSIKDKSASTTVMLLGCPSGVQKDACAWGTGFNYTIVSGNTYIAAWTTDVPAFSIGYTCVHDTASKSVTCQHNNSNEAGGVMTASDVYAAVAEDFVAASVTGGAEKLRATKVPSSASATLSPSASPASGQSIAAGAKPSPTASISSPASAQSTGAAHQPGVNVPSLLVWAGAIAVMW